MEERKAQIVFLIIAIGYLIVFLRLVYLHFLVDEEERKRIESQYITKKKVIIPRGSIRDTKDKLLAISVPKLRLYVSTKKITSPEELKAIAKEFAPIIGVSERTILRRLTSRKDYILVASNLDISLKDKLNKAKLKLSIKFRDKRKKEGEKDIGVYIDIREVPIRVYPM
ncbi:MAG: hypothetical protein GXO45_06050, partial [Aquificae bacterium]|nr:hypothetical protein [Aquificota bacterium]